MKVFRSIYFLAAVLAAVPAAAQLDAGDFANVSARGVKIPLYNKEELRFMLRSSGFEQHGGLLFADNSVIDIVRRNSDVDDLKLGDTGVYVINSPIGEVIKFWHDRLSSEGVIVSATAQVDSMKRRAEGSDVVQVRTPMLDIDGVGFTANYETRQVAVKQNVHIVLRFGGKELMECMAGGVVEKALKDPKISRFADVWADSMYIDFDKKIVTLEGDVSLEESGAALRCDKVVLLLGGSGAAEESGELDDMGVSGVSKIECFGNVRMARRDGSADDAVQSIASDYAVYDFETEKILLSGGRPSISSGGNVLTGNTMNFSQRSDLLTVEGDCELLAEVPEQDGASAGQASISADKMEFSYRNNHAEAVGNVRVKDRRGTIHAQKMTIALADDGAPAAVDDAMAITRLGGMEFSTGNKTIREIVCLGGVNFYGNGGEEGSADTVSYDYATGVITMSGNRRPWVRQGDSRLEGGEIVLEQQSERLLVKDDGLITIASDAARPTVATADLIDMNYGANSGFLKGNVKIKDAVSGIECSEMTIYLADKPGESGKNSSATADLATRLEDRQFDKTVERIVCAGGVRGHDPRGTLDCDSLTLFLKEGPEGPEIDRVEFDGNVEATAAGVNLTELDQSLPEAPQSAAPSRMYSDRGFIDMTKNLAEFTGNVRVVDDRIKIVSDKFNAYFADRTPEDAAGAAPVEPELESPELAFEPKAESNVPRQITLGEDKLLASLRFSGNVEITGKDEAGVPFSATGNDASYNVSDRMIEMTTVDGVKPILSRGGTVVECRSVEVDLSSGDPAPEGHYPRIISFEPDWEK